MVKRNNNEREGVTWNRNCPPTQGRRDPDCLMCMKIWKASWLILFCLLRCSCSCSVFYTFWSYHYCGHKEGVRSVLTLQLLFWNLILSFSIVFLFVREIQVSLRLIVTENFFLSKFIYYCLYVFQKTVFYGFLVCFPFDFLSSILVLQVFKARFGLIRPTAVTGPFCLKS